MPKRRKVRHQKYEIGVHHALHDVIHIICKYVNTSDLQHVAQVCKAWRRAAVREKEYRYLPQRLGLPYGMLNLSSKLGVIPFASLLVYDTSLEEALFLPTDFGMRYDGYAISSDCTSNGLEEELLIDFKNQLENETVVMLVDAFLTSDAVEFVVPENEWEGESPYNCDILGLFFPRKLPQASVRVASVTIETETSRVIGDDGELEDVNYVVDTFIDELGLRYEDHPQFTVILFTYNVIDYYNCLLPKVCERVEEFGKEIVWASVCAKKMLAVNDGEHQDEKYYQSIVALSITGPSIESWSTFIYFLAPTTEIMRKLEKLKERVNPNKRYYMGLFYSLSCAEPSCQHTKHPCGDNREMMNKLKHVFPNIQFTAFFKNCCKYIFQSANRESYPDRSNLKRPFDKRLLKNLVIYTSVIIISYN